MKTEITLLNIPTNRKISIDKMLTDNDSVTFLSFVAMNGHLPPECIKIIIDEDEKASELVYQLSYNSTLQEYDFHTINQTFYPRYQSIAIELIHPNESADLKRRFGFSILLKEDKDGGIPFNKMPKKDLEKELVLIQN